jgi:hypothetical protein
LCYLPGTKISTKYRSIENKPSAQLNHHGTDMLIWILFWIKKYIDLTEIRKKGIYHNKNEGLICTGLLEIVQDSKAKKK